MLGRRAWIYWTCQIAGWGASSAATVLLRLLYEPSPRSGLGTAIALCAASTAIQVGCAHGYRTFVRRRGWGQRSPLALVPRVLVASLAMGAILPFAVAPVFYVLFAGQTAPVRYWFPPAFVTYTFDMVVWNALYFMVHAYEARRHIELEKLQLAAAASEARLRGLVAQLNPHFLFNCLNSVRALIDAEPDKARDMITETANLLRYALHAGQTPTVALADEMAMVRTYLALEAIRFEDRLTTELDVAPDTRALAVPAMLVQALVENAIKHGIEALPDGGVVRVETWRDAAALHIRVTNTGALRTRAGSTQIGLANARERLRLLHGEAAALALGPGRDGTVVAEVSIPLARAADATLPDPHMTRLEVT